MGGLEIRKATLGRIAVAVLCLGAAILIIAILRHSDSNEDVNSKVFAAAVLEGVQGRGRRGARVQPPERP